MKTFETPNFKYEPSMHVPFQDKGVLEKMREISREDFINHPNPNLNVKVMDEADVGFFFMMDIFFRTKEAMVRITASPKRFENKAQTQG